MMKTLFLMVLLLGSLAIAQSPSPSPSPSPVNVDSADAILAALSNEASHDRAVGVIAAVVMLLVLLFKKYIQPRIGVGDAVLPWLAVLLSVVSGVGVSVLGGLDPASAAKVSLFSGAGAISLWESVFKLFTKKSA